MDSYRDVYEIMKELRPVDSHLKALGKIRAKTEDKKLIENIDRALTSLNQLLLQLSSKKGAKSIHLSLDVSKDLPVRELYAYCEKFASTGKPEWQVLAEKNGWIPKPKE